EINDNSKFSAAVFKRRFKGGLKGFALEYLKWIKNNSPEKIDVVIETEPLKLKTKVNKITVKTTSVDKTLSQNRFYNGNAAEYLVVSELLFRGYNAQKLPVDEGLDVFAVKDNNLYLIQ